MNLNPKPSAGPAVAHEAFVAAHLHQTLARLLAKHDGGALSATQFVEQVAQIAHLAESNLEHEAQAQALHQLGL